MADWRFGIAGWRFGIGRAPRATALVWAVCATMWGLAGVSAQGVDGVDSGYRLDRSWLIAVWSESGVMRPYGRFASNPLPPVFANPLDARAELKSALVHSVGMELRFPARGLAIRAGWETSTGGEAQGFLATCELLGCEPEAVSATLTGIVLEARSSDAGRGRRVTPLLAVGAGRRWYAFGETDCSDREGDERIICDAIAQMFQSPGSHTVLRASAGVDAELGRFRAGLAATMTAGSYSGGDGQSQGRWYPELRVTLGVGLVVF